MRWGGELVGLYEAIDGRYTLYHIPSPALLKTIREGIDVNQLPQALGEKRGDPEEGDINFR